ncbi:MULTISPECIES: EthD family reductase [Gordonia]|uniref:EthD family reductase n=1 Tax=Gordonia TaxID=2053 RepID=UPI001EF596B9|nr:EthD family reductase [Gordonia sp. McavH-238-E]MCG7631443.1 EthD family reductase [Gordonia sp. McavH-238-E]
MTIRVSVCYGTPSDPAAFDDHYTNAHIPMARKVPGLQAYVYGKVSSLDDSEPPYYSVAGLYFPDRDALRTALVSPEMRATGRDVKNFASGGATMFITDEEVVGP